MSTLHTHTFQLPFEAYPSQKAFMEDAYQCFDESRFGLFESPTGSGKTIAILCAALTWLKDNMLSDAMSRMQPRGATDLKVPRWVQQGAEKQLKAAAADIIALESEQLRSVRHLWQKEIVMTDDGVRLRPGIKRRRDHDGACTEPPLRADMKNPREKLQIVICSRTFSQLNQYVKEFRRLGKLTEDIRLGMALGRNHCCVNPNVRSRCKTNAEFNDECRRSACDFRRNVDQLAEVSACFPMDIEDLKSVGNGICACPYYASLKNIPECDIVLVPYVSVFQDSIRQNLGIRTDGNILIVDEAHNLGDAITEASSSIISTEAMATLARQCRSFCNKFGNALDSREKDAIASIETVANVLSDCTKIQQDKTQYVDNTFVLSISSFMVCMGLETVRFHEILTFLTSGDFCKRLRSWAERLWRGELKNAKSMVDETNGAHTCVIYEFMHFVSTLLAGSAHDRVLVSFKSGSAILELFSLSADEKFRLMVEKSKSTLLMSGTLSPIEEFLRLPPSSSEPLVHKGKPIFPQERFYAAVISTDEKGLPLVYDRASREHHRELNALFRIIVEFATVVPNGIVCFLSSYEFLQGFKSAFEESAHMVEVLRVKDVFFETQDGNKDLFVNYATRALNKGAILFAVYGGSQSEGIDFRDGLARLVLLVGLPYPPDGVKLHLKRTYCNSRALQPDLPKCQRDVYSTLSSDMRTLICFKTINQSIGRAMRHKNDFAAVILLDSRYNDPRSRHLLPSYVVESLLNTQASQDAGIPSIRRQLTQFYQVHTIS